jgi:DNA-binding MarR family transcriptional regulator
MSSTRRTKAAASRRAAHEAPAKGTAETRKTRAEAAQRAPRREPASAKAREIQKAPRSGQSRGAVSPALKPSAKSASPLERELAQSFFELLMLHRANFRGLISQTGLSGTQLQVLMAVGERPMTMRELSTAALTEPSNLTGVVDKLEARGLVARKASTEDRRSKQVSATRAGAAFRQDLLDHIKEPVPWMRALTQADQKRLLEIVRRAVALALKDGPPADWGG